MKRQKGEKVRNKVTFSVIGITYSNRCQSTATSVDVAKEAGFCSNRMNRIECDVAGLSYVASSRWPAVIICIASRAIAT